MLDAHVHFWNFDPIRDSWITDDMSVIQRNFLPPDAAAVFAASGVEGCVAVQASQTEAENDFLLELSKQSDLIKGIVGWVDLRSPNLEERLTYYKQFDVIKGWRHVVQGEPHEFLLGKEFQQGVALLKKFDYTYDILIFHHQLEPALEFVKALPGQRFVIDHVAKPDIKNKNIASWVEYMRAIAAHEHLYCKISGMFTEADWKHWQPEDLHPYLDVVFEAFGTKRLMFGSDWPVILVAGQYNQWKTVLDDYMRNLSADERQDVLHNNAVRFYKL